MEAFSMRRWSRRGPAVSDDGLSIERVKPRHFALSVLGHVALVLLILAPWLGATEDDAVPMVVPYLQADGASGAAGGPRAAGAGADKRTAEPAPSSDVSTDSESAAGAASGPAADAPREQAAETSARVAQAEPEPQRL